MPDTNSVFGDELADTLYLRKLSHEQQEAVRTAVVALRDEGKIEGQTLADFQALLSQKIVDLAGKDELSEDDNAAITDVIEDIETHYESNILNFANALTIRFPADSQQFYYDDLLQLYYDKNGYYRDQAGSQPLMWEYTQRYFWAVDDQGTYYYYNEDYTPYVPAAAPPSSDAPAASAAPAADAWPQAAAPPASAPAAAPVDYAPAAEPVAAAPAATAADQQAQEDEQEIHRILLEKMHTVRAEISAPGLSSQEQDSLIAEMLQEFLVKEDEKAS